ncbi:MAG: ComEC/Rec2 family competence protein [Candidatus Spechtbacterales bacterium]
MATSKVFIYICLSFLGGVVLNSLILVPQFFVLGFFILGLMIVAVFFVPMGHLSKGEKNKRIAVVGFCLLLFAAGVYRHQMFERPKDNLDYYQKNQSIQKVTSLRYLKDKLSESVDHSLSPPQSSLLGAIMLGETERLSYELKGKLNRSGTRHITSISGMNIMILASLLIGLGLILGMWRGQAFYFALITIILFIIMVGAPPSAVRAGIMGGIVLFAEKIGRLSQAQRLLVIAAAVMLAFNPLLLKFDIGFQLSFLATLGIAKLSPWFLEKFSRIPKKFELQNVVAMTFPAVIFTAPVLAASFGQVSVISFFTNILIVPVLGLVLALGFFAGILGIISESLGQIAFWPVWLFLTYVYKIIDWSSGLPFAVMEITVFPWYLTVLYFALLWWGIKYFKLER